MWPAIAVLAPLTLAPFIHSSVALGAATVGTGLFMAGLSLTPAAPLGDGKRRPWLAAYFAAFSCLTAAMIVFDVPLWVILAVPIASVVATLPFYSIVKQQLND